MNTLDHLRKLVRNYDDLFDCPHCKAPTEEPHGPDCAWVAAKAHVEEADRNACEVMAIIDEATAACRVNIKTGDTTMIELVDGPPGQLKLTTTKMPRGFTLIELLVVIAIIVVVSAVALPTVISAMSHRQVSEGARILSAALAGARDAAIRDNSPRGIRLLPDPTFSGLNPTTGLLDPAQALAANRILPIGSAPDYSEGLVTPMAATGDILGVSPGRPALVLMESPYTIVKVPVYNGNLETTKDVQQLNSPTSWFWNVRIGDKIQINNAGVPYTVVGPMTQSNPEMFVNVGAPGVAPTIEYPAGSGIHPEYLLLVNGQDDNANGWIDEGFDGVDNDGLNGTDEAAEWEREAWLGSVANQALTAVPYTIHRRPAPTGNARAVELPTGVVIDLSTWGSTQERSRLPVNQFTGYVDILVNPNGTVVPTSIYSTPASAGMAGAFYHFWLAERSDVFSPQGTVSPVLPVRPDPTDPQPNRFNGSAIKGEYRLVTLFARTGLAGQLEDMPFDWANIGTASYFAGAPFVTIQQGAR